MDIPQSLALGIKPGQPGISLLRITVWEPDAVKFRRSPLTMPNRGTKHRIGKCAVKSGIGAYDRTWPAQESPPSFLTRQKHKVDLADEASVLHDRPA